MNIKKDLIYREIAGEHMLVSLGIDSSDRTGLFVLSDVGARIWELLSEGKGREQIIDTILEEYEIDEMTVRKDVADFFNKLSAEEIIEEI